MKEVSILLTKYSDWVSNLVYVLCGRGYTHASISLEENEDTYYSFNYLGFAVETLGKHRRRGVTKSKCFRVKISDQSYESIRQRIHDIELERSSYRYTRLGVLCCILHIPYHINRRYFCSQFVAELLENSGAMKLSRPSNYFLPNHFLSLMEDKRCQVIDNVV